MRGASVELFRTPGGQDSEPFATFLVNGHYETWPVSGRGFKRWLSKRFYDQHATVPGSQALNDAVNVLAGKAIHGGPEHAVHVRLAGHNGAIYLDLCDEHWRAVKVSAGGWRVMDTSPVKFVRRRGMLALPQPVRGGSLERLRALVNLPDEDSWVLFVSWLVSTLRPNRPCPVLAVNGEQGSGKSALCRVGRGLIDPNQAPLRRPPRDERDLMIAATNGWVVAYDNLSGIAPALSDALCCLATGGGFGTRELYTDGEEKLFSAMRPVVVNGIEDVATRPDLLDRSLCLTLPAIPDERRRDEEGLWKWFDRGRPQILGALLDAVAAGLRNVADVRLDSLPRMADFTKWAVACAPALGFDEQTFLRAYAANRAAADQAALGSSQITRHLLRLLDDEDWSGTAGELLGMLDSMAADAERRSPSWPRNPRKLSGDLRRLAPNLRRAGVDVVFTDRLCPK